MQSEKVFLKTMKKISITCIVAAMICFCMMACSAGGMDEEKDIEKDVSENIMESDSSSEDEIQFAYPYTITLSFTNSIELCIESENIFLIGLDNGKYGYVGRNRKEITGYIYEDAYPFSEGLAAVSIDGKYGFIGQEGETVIEFLYDDLKPFSEGLAYFAKGEEYGFLKKDGSVAFRLDCDSVSSFTEGKAYFSVDGKYGYIDSEGQKAIPAKYDDADFYRNGIAFVSLDGCKGAIDTKGNQVIPIQYDEIERVEGYIYAWKEDDVTYFSLEGIEISEEDMAALTEKNETEPENGLYTIVENSRLTVYDEKDKKLLSVPCDYDTYGIYQDNVNLIAQNFDSKDVIVLLGDEKDKDLSEVLLKNSVTPRKYAAYQAVKEEEKQIYTVSLYAENVKFFQVDGLENPVLYYYVDHLNRTFGWPMSVSALFVMENDETKRVLVCEQCGGTAGGDYVCFYKEKEGGKIYPGIDGNAGGFGGYAVYQDVYEVNNGELKSRLSLNTTQWYDTDEIEYLVNEISVSKEDFVEQDGLYRIFSLY